MFGEAQAFVQVSLIGFPGFTTGDFYRDAMILATDLDRFALSIKSFREPLNKSIREVIIPSIRANFEAEGRPKWQRLSLETVKSRGAAGPILNRTGRLKRVAQQLNIWRVTSDSATIVGLDSRVPYAHFHQGGTSRMPQRVFILLQDEDVENIEQIFYQWLVDRSVRMGRFPP